MVLLQVKPELAAVSKVDNSVESFARSHYEVSCEVAINEQVSCKSLQMTRMWVPSEAHLCWASD